MLKCETQVWKCETKVLQYETEVLQNETEVLQNEAKSAMKQSYVLSCSARGFYNSLEMFWYLQQVLVSIPIIRVQSIPHSIHKQQTIYPNCTSYRAGWLGKHTHHSHKQTRLILIFSLLPTTLSNSSSFQPPSATVPPSNHLQQQFGRAGVLLTQATHQPTLVHTYIRTYVHTYIRTYAVAHCCCSSTLETELQARQFSFEWDWMPG